MPYLRSILVHGEVRYVNENGWELFTQYFCVIYAPHPQILIKYSESMQSTVDIILELDHDSSLTNSVDEDDLRNASGYLNECLRDMEERKPLIVTQVRQEVFEASFKWMSTKSIDIMQMPLGNLGDAPRSNVLFSAPLPPNDDVQPKNPERTSPHESNGLAVARPSLALGSEPHIKHKRDFRDARSLDNLTVTYDLDVKTTERLFIDSVASDDQVYTHHIDLYQFARSFQARDFNNAIMAKIQQFTKWRLNGGTRVLPSFDVMIYANERTGPSSKLSQHLASCYAEHAPPKVKAQEKVELSDFPAAFLVNALVSLPMDDWGTIRDHDPRNPDHFCHWHDHCESDDKHGCQRETDHFQNFLPLPSLPLPLPQTRATEGQDRDSRSMKCPATYILTSSRRLCEERAAHPVLYPKSTAHWGH